MKRRAESAHETGLRRSARNASKQNLENEQVTAKKGPYPELSRESEEDSDASEECHNESADGHRHVNSIQCDSSSVQHYMDSIQHCMNSIRQYFPNVPGPIYLVLLSTIIISLANFLYSDKKTSDPTCNDPLKTLYEQYPQHVNMWEAVNTSVKICTRSPKPGVTLLLHNGDGNIAGCLVNRTATLLSKLIGASEADEYCYVDGRNAHQVYEADLFLSEMMKQRKKLGVLVFNNLELMDPKLFKELHFITDHDQNIKDKSILLLVLKVEVETFKDHNLDDLAHKRLAELWKEKLDDRFQPIVGRITNNLGSIDENIVTKCP